MKIASILPVLATLASFASADAGTQCSKKNSYVTNAIGKFCQNQAMVVPSKYATQGMRSTFSYVFININGKCNPPQWVPREYCMSQFYQMCVDGDKHGTNSKNFGKNGCQEWNIMAGQSKLQGQ